MYTLNVAELGIAGHGTAYRNLPVSQLVEHAIARGEGTLTDTGALSVHTGKYTGRSPDDKFYVDSPAVHDDIAWGSVNRPISREIFRATARLWWIRKRLCCVRWTRSCRRRKSRKRH